MEHVVRMPLALYSFLAAGAEAASLGIVLHLYSIGWCGAQSLEKQGYKLSTGFALMLVSTLLSLASSVLAMMRFKCCR
ncbi:hypothetical protein AGDE_14370 [Angomonas deanei]|uniref:Uncharacterized protein n=1 Tax=Angomonas deanei TaxID=59799 RepID=A0A7G2CIX6_9TRYP|nr:hypothetical protein AGDE_14370 [Angomonas deanei]CAD2219798.1 hypothetical protein, conserved [Angomonas deanei]|eukprot:EPY20961.1 hypothetical protein AGDE_14370 [Angomonas deanei]